MKKMCRRCQANFENTLQMCFGSFIIYEEYTSDQNNKYTFLFIQVSIIMTYAVCK